MARAGWPDMRRNLKAYIDGDWFKEAEGEWLLYRRFIKGSLTPQFSPTRDEAIGGEKFRYTMHMIRGIFLPIGGQFGLTANDLNIMGTVPASGYLLMFKWWIPPYTKSPVKLRPAINDLIFEIDGSNGAQPPKPPFIFRDKYAILATLKSRGDMGRSEGWIVHIDGRN